MKVFSVGLIAALVMPTVAFGQSVDAKKIAEYSKTLPVVTLPTFDEDRRATLAISAISCAADGRSRQPSYLGGAALS